MSVGMVIMRPTSIVVAGAGSSASVRAAGGVEFASATSLSLNGVFTSDYDDYMIVVRGTNTATAAGADIRLRAAGTDATGSDYTIQRIDADNTTISGGRGTASFGRFTVLNATTKSGGTGFIYGPYLAQPTAYRVINASGGNTSGAWIRDWAGTHSLSTSYDGITLSDSFDGTSTIEGLVTVYGLAQ